MVSRSRLRRSLLTGIAVVLPVGALALLLWQLGGFLWSLAVRLGTAPATLLGVEGPALTAVAFLAAVVLGIALLLLLGELTRHRFGGAAVDLVDTAIERVPGLGPVYREMRRSRAIIAPEGGTRFSDVALVELSPDVQVIGFVVGPASDEVRRTLSDEDYRTVYLPLAPNPSVGGHLVHVPEDILIETDLTVRQALATILTLDAGEAETTDAPFDEVFHAVSD